MFGVSSASIVPIRILSPAPTSHVLANPIRLLYAKNIISRCQGIPEQQLSFFAVVENRAFEKEVEIHWAGENGDWKKLRANFDSARGPGYELWSAHTTLQLSGDEAELPGDIQFSLSYRTRGETFWDEGDNRQNYSLNADAGVRLGHDFAVVNLDTQPRLHTGQSYLPITVAIRQSLRPQDVFVEWTIDRWETSQRTPCFFKRKHWDKAHGSNARNPNRYDCAVWIGQLQINRASRVQYAIGCQTEQGLVWDNNFGQDYIAARKTLKVLTLNLHCYQEENQQEKFSTIAKAINDLDVDLVCLQEVAEPWNGGQGDWNANSARIIRDQLRTPYDLHVDWSHFGFGQYREGCAILSKYEFLQRDACFVSSERGMNSIHSRKIVMGQVHVPDFGAMNIFSAHLSWWANGFQEQFNNLHAWVGQRMGDGVVAALVCGDFNLRRGSEGYGLVTAVHGYADAYLEARSRWRDHDPGENNDLRIDFAFVRKGGPLIAVGTRELFNGHDYNRVSDHTGYYFEFESR